MDTIRYSQAGIVMFLQDRDCLIENYTSFWPNLQLPQVLEIVVGQLTRRRSLQALKPRWVVSQTYSPGPGLLPLRELSGRIRS